MHKRSWFDVLIEDYLVCIVALSFFTPQLIVLLSPDKFTSESEHNFGLFFGVFIILFLVYFFYRKIVERKLIKVATGLNADESEALLCVFLKQQGEIEKKLKDHVVVFRKSSFFQPIKIAVFLIENDYLYFCILQNAQHIGPPTLFYHIFFKRQIEKLFNKKATNK